MNCNLLIVDDSPILRKAIKKVARVAGVPADQIFEAGNGQEALDALDASWIDLVLLDLNMPVMDGEEFVKRLRSHPDHKDIAVVVVSTESNIERLQRMRHMGVLDTLHKPFEPEDLCRLISRVTGEKAA